ncbi:MAG: hypothetical protein WCJ13_05400 [Coriobacteriia bacterium]
MSTNTNRSRAQTDGQNVASLVVLAPALDVPGLLADRIGDLYAAEERSHRAQRTERMILKAQNLK